MSNHEKMYSHGVCPYCGNDNNSTICDTYNVILKEISYTPWWKFWDKYCLEHIGANEKSKKWLKLMPNEIRYQL